MCACVRAYVHACVVGWVSPSPAIPWDSEAGVWRESLALGKTSSRAFHPHPVGNYSRNVLRRLSCTCFLSGTFSHGGNSLKRQTHRAVWVLAYLELVPFTLLKAGLPILPVCLRWYAFYWSCGLVSGMELVRWGWLGTLQLIKILVAFTVSPQTPLVVKGEILRVKHPALIRE